MICKSYLELTEFEQSLYLAKVIHSVTNNDELFKLGKDVIELGLLKGLFNNVKFGNEEIAQSETAIDSV